MKKTAILLVLITWAAIPARSNAAEVQFGTPGFSSTRMDAQGRLVEDWGAFGIRFSGPGVAARSPAVSEAKLEGVVPAARAVWNLGVAAATVTAYRAPVWPSGLNVYTVEVQETAARDADLVLSLEVPENVRPGAKTLSAGGRTVVTLPGTPKVDSVSRDWGWHDDAVALFGWARPAKECDPAFKNIRAGMNGVPINYRFKVEPRSSHNVVLGLCESHWTQAGQRPVTCQVEGAPLQEVDPIERWGQHQPGAVVFAAKDANGDGLLDVAVLPKIGAPDLNPILNVIWMFPAGGGLNLEQVAAGKLNALATRYVDVGGPGDQSFEGTSRVEYAIKLPSGGRSQMTFWVACAGGSVPMPDRSAWTSEKLFQAALDVWKDVPLSTAQK